MEVPFCKTKIAVGRFLSDLSALYCTKILIYFIERRKGRGKKNRKEKERGGRERGEGKREGGEGRGGEEEREGGGGRRRRREKGVDFLGVEVLGDT